MSLSRRLIDRLLLVLLFLAVPTLLVTANVWWAFTTRALYEYGFSRHNVSQDTGIPPGELRRVADEFIAYFQSSEPYLEVKAQVRGQERSLFSDREIIHMRDVKGLVQDVGQARLASLAFLLAYGLGGFALLRGRFAWLLARRLRRATLATAIGVVVAGLLVAIGFPWLFYLFHQLSFSNDFWLLNPATDYLVRLFPSGFFFEATLFIALATLVEALGAAALAWMALRLLRHGNPTLPAGSRSAGRH